VRNLVVSVEDHFESPDPGYSARSRSAVVLAVGSPGDVLQEQVLAGLRERLSVALLGHPATDPSVVVFAGQDALEPAESELAGRGELGLTRAGVPLLDAGAWIVVPPPGAAAYGVSDHRVQVVDAPLPAEVVVALRAVAQLDPR
jgi:hypothetical protein